MICARRLVGSCHMLGPIAQTPGWAMRLGSWCTTNRVRRFSTSRTCRHSIGNTGVARFEASCVVIEKSHAIGHVGSHMYSTCLFCNSELGRNEALEVFPVGRRLAFDARKGRLWVVCRKCERWNLTPLEERWEAIEQAERQFSTTRQRV